MSDLKERVYRHLVGRDVTLRGPVTPTWGELVAYLWQRGGWARLRGWVHGARLGACGGRLLVGARVRLMFPRHIHAGRNVLIGDDSYLSGFSTSGVRLGDNVRIREGAWIQATSVLDQPGVGLTIGEGTYIGPRAVFGAGGGITIGRRVLVGSSVHLLAENHAISDPQTPIHSQGVTRAGITIGDDAWVGDSVIVLDGVNIGRGAVIGAGSVVTRDVADGAVAVGNPAREIRQRFGSDAAAAGAPTK
jgi:acetyltransferase-like isoleucine patch superfamily enzyme